MSDKQRWHDQGERDRSNDRGYKPPHGIFEDLTTWTRDGMRRIADENQAYKQGWRNTDNQKKK